MDRIAEGCSENNGDHFGGQILAIFGVHHFSGRRAFFFQFKVWGKGGGRAGSGLYPTKPITNFP